jgi:hypothetical protein
MEHLFCPDSQIWKIGKLTFITDSLFFAKVKDFVAKFLKTNASSSKSSYCNGKTFPFSFKISVFPENKSCSNCTFLNLFHHQKSKKIFKIAINIKCRMRTDRIIHLSEE